MQITDLIQGSPEWLAYRAQHFASGKKTASALLAMLQTKAAFSEEQKARILSLKPDAEDATPAAAPAEPWPFPQPVQFAGAEPANVCAECMQLRAELAAARQQIDHLNRLALRSRSTAAGR